MAKRPGILLPGPTLVMSALILAMIFLSSTSMAYNFNTEEKTLTPAGGRMQNSLYGYHRFHPTINDKVNFLEVCLHCFWYIFSKKECGRAVWCDRMFQLFVRIVDLLLASRNIFRPIVINIVRRKSRWSIHPSFSILILYNENSGGPCSTSTTSSTWELQRRITRPATLSQNAFSHQVHICISSWNKQRCARNLFDTRYLYL